MTTRTSRTRLRALVLAAVAPLMAASFALIASPAEASWTTGTTVHDAKVQVCKVKRDGGWVIRLRVNNRKASHGHYGTLFRMRGDHTKSVKVWAKRGKVSRKKALRWRKGDSLETMISERNGVGAGGAIHVGAMARC